jgi:hypothetical protein
MQQHKIPGVSKKHFQAVALQQTLGPANSPHERKSYTLDVGPMRPCEIVALCKDGSLAAKRARVNFRLSKGERCLAKLIAPPEANHGRGDPRRKAMIAKRFKLANQRDKIKYLERKAKRERERAGHPQI